MNVSEDPEMVELPQTQPYFESLYTVSPLVIVGTRESDGSSDLAPKHMAFPLGWSDYFGFVCTAEHSTYLNAARTGEFTVSYPGPDGVLDASFAAAPRDPDGCKPALEEIDTVEGDVVDAPAVADSYCILECRVDRTVEGFGKASLIAGEVVGKHVHEDVYRSDDTEAEELLSRSPALAYLYPDRIATVDESEAFPFPEDFNR